jgi:hypothetical protein
MPFSGGLSPAFLARMPWMRPQPVTQPQPFNALLEALTGRANQGGIRSAADARDVAKRGQADASLGNIANAMSLGASLMGGTGALKTAIKEGLSQTDLGKKLGVESPFDEPTGFAKPNEQQLGGITSNNPIEARNQAARATDRAYREARERERKREQEARDRATASGRGTSASGGSRGGSSRESRGV